MKKSSQNRAGDASMVAIPEQVSVAMAEIAGNMSEGLLALAVGAGLQVMQTLMEADVTAARPPCWVNCWPRTCPGWTWWRY